MRHLPTAVALAPAADIDALDPNIEGIRIDGHDRRFRSLLCGQGGRQTTGDESGIAFDGEAGLAAATLVARFAEEGGMVPRIDDQGGRPRAPIPT